MQTDEGSPAAPSILPGPSPDGSPSKLKLSTKLTDRLRKLEPWQISPSLVKFPETSPQFHGAFATVSQAFLFCIGTRGMLGQSDHLGDKVMDSNGRSPQSSNPVSKPKDSADDCKEFQEEAMKSSEIGFKDQCAIEKKQSLPGEATEWLEAVAVKKMKISGNPMRVLGLALREAEFLVEFDHPQIITLEGFVQDISKDLIWLVFPWRDNGTLRDFVASHDWEIPERISLIDDVASGVKYLHSREPPVYHGDLKSVNVLVNSRCRALITDFGSARRYNMKEIYKEGLKTFSNPRATLSLEATFCASTNTITLTGDQYTLRWAAPELLKEEPCSLSCDIWSLGWVAYEVMTNSIPFEDVKDAIVIKRVIQGDLPSITNDSRMSLIQALCSLMTACWSIDPTKRPTAMDCSDSIAWMPMVVPNSGRRTDKAGSTGRSPELLMELGDMHKLQSDWPNAYKFFNEALGIYTGIADMKGQGHALRRLAELRLIQNEYSDSIVFFSRSLQIYTYLGDREGRAHCLVGLGEVHRIGYQLGKATWFYNEAQQIYTEIGSRQFTASTLEALAGIHLCQRELDQAAALCSEALQIRTEMGDGGPKEQALMGLALLHQVRNEYTEALTFYSEALQICANVGDRHGRAYALTGIAGVYHARKQYSEAIALYSEALQIRIDINDRRGRAFTLKGLAEVYCEQEDYRNAIHHYEKAAELFGQIGSIVHQAFLLAKAAEVCQLVEETEAN